MDTVRIQEITNLRAEIYRKAKTPKDRLKALISTFANWSNDESKHKLMREIAIKMNAKEIDTLRSLIYEQVHKINAKSANVLTDQILFIIIGAFKFEIKRDGFSKPWELAELSLNSILAAPQKSRLGTFNTLLLASFLLLMTAIFFFNNQPNFGSQSKKTNLQVNTYIDSVQPLPSPFVPSHFYSLRNQMSKSVCLIPQAATLPAEQRAAFLTFLNTGEIEMSQLTNLQRALSLVHCEFMPLTLSLNH